MGKKLSLTLKTLIILMLVTSIGITSVKASPQTVTIDVVPDDAGSVYVWKTVGSDLGFIGIVTKKSSFKFDTSDNIVIQPTDRADLIKGDYRYIRLCDDVECITGTYKGPLSEGRSTWDVKVYYELPKDTEPPTINSVTLSKTSVNVGDKIEVTVDTTDNVGVTRVTADNGYGSSYTTLIMISKNLWKGQITAAEGSHSVYVVSYDITKNYGTDASRSYTAVQISTPSSTPSSSPTPMLTPTPSSTSTPTLSSTSAPTPSSTPTPTPTPTKMKAESSESSDTYGRINIASDPSEADIFLNNIPYGNTPYSADIETGSYTLKITKDGYKDFTKKVIVKESTPTDVTVTLVSINETTSTENNQSNQTTMFSGGNSKQSNGDSTTSLINNMTLLAAVVVIAATAIICVIMYSRKNTYVNYNMMPIQPTSNEKSMIVIKRLDR